MAFPTIVATGGGNSGANTTTHTVNLPDGSDVQGRLLIVVMGVDGTVTLTWPANWVLLYTLSAEGLTGEARYKIIDGTEGYAATNATIGVTSGAASEGSAHNAYLIAGHDSSTNPPEDGTALSAGTADPNPPACTPTGGAKDYLWIAATSNDGDVAVTAAPASYTDLINNRWANVGGAGVGTAVRELNTDTTNPGAFTMAADGHVANTIAVHPGNEPSGGVSSTGLWASPVIVQPVHVASLMALLPIWSMGGM